MCSSDLLTRCCGTGFGDGPGDADVTDNCGAADVSAVAAVEACGARDAAGADVVAAEVVPTVLDGTNSGASAQRDELGDALHATAVSKFLASGRPTGSLIRCPLSSKTSGCQASLPIAHTKELSRFKYASRP